jgi:disulfide bond formation protein DsbB
VNRPAKGFQENFLLRNIKQWSLQRWPWMLLAVVAVVMEAGALYLQHGLQVEPCNECIYIRSGVAAMGVAGLLGAIAPRFLVLRLVALAAWLAALGWSLYRAHLLLNLERLVREGAESSCARFKGFPSWLPLDKWLPEMFEPRAMCGEVGWTFLGQSITFWIAVSMWGMALAAVLVLLAQFKRSAR